MLLSLKVRYDDELKRVVCEPIEMAQEFRKFDFESPWEQFPEHRDTKDKEALPEGEKEQNK